MATKCSVLMLVMVALTGFAMEAQAAPDLSGTWEINVAKSNTGEMPPPESYVRTIEQSGSEIKIVTKQTMMMGDMTNTTNCPTAGGECTVKTEGGFGGGASTKSASKWDGDTLVIDSTIEFQGMSLKRTEKMSLAADGKTLTVDAMMSSDMGDMNSKLVLDKK